MINLLHGDCLELMKTIPDKSIDMVLTDPPYKLISGGCIGKKTPGFSAGFKNGKVFKFNEIKFDEWMPELSRVMKDKSHIYVFINGRNLAPLINEMEKFFKFKNIITWKKSTKTPCRNYMNQTEFIVMMAKNGCKGIREMGQSNHFEHSNHFHKKNHPTEKPVVLLENFIHQSSNISQTILDPFMGSGSTGVACKNLNRNFIGIEKDDKYFEIAKGRINGKQMD